MGMSVRYGRGDEMAHDVFVSYASRDKATADAVVATLERRGIRCWAAPRDVTPGDKWADAIVRAISRGRVMVMVFSSGANASQHIIREVELAAEHGVPVIPLRVENVLPCPNLDYYIAGTHWLDAIDPPLEAHLGRLAVVVSALLSGTETAATAISSVGSNAGRETAPLAPPPPPPAATTAAAAPTSVLSPPKPMAAPIREAPGPLQPETVVAPPPQRRHTGVWVGAVAAALLVIGAVIAVWLLGFGGAEEEADPASEPAAAAPSAGASAVDQPSPSEPQPERVGTPMQLRVARATPDEVKLVWKRPQKGGEVAYFRVIRDGKSVGGEIDGRSFVDEKVSPASRYRYRVVAIGVDGSQASTDTLLVKVPALPSSPGTVPSSPGTPGGSEPPACDGILTPAGECIPWG